MWVRAPFAVMVLACGLGGPDVWSLLFETAMALVSIPFLVGEFFFPGLVEGLSNGTVLGMKLAVSLLLIFVVVICLTSTALLLQKRSREKEEE